MICQVISKPSSIGCVLVRMALQPSMLLWAVQVLHMVLGWYVADSSGALPRVLLISADTYSRDRDPQLDIRTC